MRYCGETRHRLAGSQNPLDVECLQGSLGPPSLAGREHGPLGSSPRVPVKCTDKQTQIVYISRYSDTQIQWYIADACHSTYNRSAGRLSTIWRLRPTCDQATNLRIRRKERKEEEEEEQEDEEIGALVRVYRENPLLLCLARCACLCTRTLYPPQKKKSTREEVCTARLR